MICDPQKEDKKGPHAIFFPMDEDAKLDTKRLRQVFNWALSRLKCLDIKHHS